MQRKIEIGFFFFFYDFLEFFYRRYRNWNFRLNSLRNSFFLSTGSQSKISIFIEKQNIEFALQLTSIGSCDNYQFLKFAILQ